MSKAGTNILKYKNQTHFYYACQLGVIFTMSRYLLQSLSV